MTDGHEAILHVVFCDPLVGAVAPVPRSKRRILVKQQPSPADLRRAPHVLHDVPKEGEYVPRTVQPPRPLRSVARVTGLFDTMRPPNRLASSWSISRSVESTTTNGCRKLPPDGGRIVTQPSASTTSAAHANSTSEGIILAYLPSGGGACGIRTHRTGRPGPAVFRTAALIHSRQRSIAER